MVVEIDIGIEISLWIVAQDWKKEKKKEKTFFKMSNTYKIIALVTILLKQLWMVNSFFTKEKKTVVVDQHASLKFDNFFSYKSITYTNSILRSTIFCLAHFQHCFHDVHGSIKHHHYKLQQSFLKNDIEIRNDIDIIMQNIPMFNCTP